MSSQTQGFQIEQRVRKPRFDQVFQSRSWIVALAIGTALLPSCMSSNPGSVEAGPDGTWSVAFENDGVAGQDNNYSNGVGVGWTSADAEKYADDSITGRSLLRAVSLR